MGLKSGIGVCGSVALLMSGCSAHSAFRVTTQSIVGAPLNRTVLADRPWGRGTWHFIFPRGTRHTVTASTNGSVLRVTTPPHVGRGILRISAGTSLLPSRAPGSVYQFTADVRAENVGSPLVTEVRLNYVGGGGRIVGQSINALGEPSGKRGRWSTKGTVTIQVVAKASSRLVSINVLALDSGKYPFSGSVWMTAPKLRLLTR